jgi:hypothetical protein
LLFEAIEIKISKRNHRFIEREKRYGIENKKEVANYFKSDLDKNKFEIAILNPTLQKRERS